MGDQLSLFPEAFEVEEAAFAALEELDIEQGLELIGRAREADPGLPNLEAIEGALRWLAGEGRVEATPEHVARLFLRLPRAVGAGELPLASARFVDRCLARIGIRLRTAFVDEAEGVHVGALFLVLDRPEPAARVLRESLDEEHRHRADLWSYLADALLLEERGEEARTCYARALLTSPADVDFFRIRDARIARILADLLREHSEETARRRLAAEAWIEGAVSIPRGNDWFVPERGIEPEPELARLLWRDRTCPPGRTPVEERERMQALDPELFARYLARSRELEQSELRW